MEIEAVEASYRRWAPIYDRTFGAVTQRGRREAVARINAIPPGRDGVTRVLEIGVGTGLALPHYAPHIRVTGIDASEAMLERARAAHGRRPTVESLRIMDARSLDFADESFDVVAAMHVLSVVPEPRRVMAEIARVLRPGGQAVTVTHFAVEGRGARAALERAMAPLADRLGWHSDFSRAEVLSEPRLRPGEERRLPPLRLMTLLVLHRI
ncbi:phosphatidylethanolamine N-methyltransferase/phosphatidyl-N-methylethanolamine N-methyltransferase [Rubellimicrobium thermophilum DSM 16684]|uniref:Phosphatidylethanolamine N-methyltransferase/phosphatidyl-N-methylethanolamine N-methyltransferase n=2 Tax=Rubellimicrobium thermophilum DSM 16684 TaxID=1123069 RepID=S9SHS0_9RHOB|nr:class I SAM-dependent methyltransferase [Rubellimicrobium thermophilum]EPX85889.1 phosphatidylethanolamine N-methyltransferase/phosphatidyl-N-methylethanolamine N-methyltransferase [Rubellimicrobium thermophilum DSM 16684]